MLEREPREGKIREISCLIIIVVVLIAIRDSSIAKNSLTSDPCRQSAVILIIAWK